MSDQELNHVESVFHAVLELAPDAREAYLQKACNGDKSLYAEVSSLISAFDSREGFIEEPALNLGLRVLTQSSEQSMVGKTIGPYNVLSRLGKGGMGEVYLAEDTRLGRKVALKFLSQEFVGDNWAKRQLVKEAQAVAMLDHPNICPVYGIEEIEDHLFIVMQYVEGETLAELISENTISLEKVLAFARQIVGALAEAHAHGIIHRDIKPKNIMVTRSDQVKVLDFGLAKTVRQHAGVPDDSVSHLNEVRAGTVSYMSPEQLRGERLDFRSDIFSLGTVLYEMIENVRLFARNNEADTITAILTSELPPLRRSLTQFPQIDQIVRKCLEKDRNNRYHSASEVSLALSEPIREAKSLLQFKHTWPYPVLIALSLALLILAAFLYVNRPKNNQFTGINQATTVSIQTLAVLPLEDSTGRPDASLTDGFVETLIDKLSVLPNMRVVPFTSTVKYKGKKIDPQQVGKELGVDTILVGTLIDRKDSLVLESKLLRTSDGSQVWVVEHQINWSTALTVGKELTRQVADSLQLRLEDSSLSSRGTSSVEAFREYMTGRYYWRNRDIAKIERAIVNFKKAIELDPAYAQAWAGLADCYVLQSTVSFGKTPTEEAMTRAEAAAKEALTLNPQLAEAHTSLGVVSLRFEWNLQNAEQELRRAIELDPNYAPAHYWYSHLLLILERPSEAVNESLIAKKLDPTSSPSVMNYCRVLSNAGQFNEAISCYKNVLLENPKNQHVQYLLALVYQETGKSDEAIRALEMVYQKDKALAGAGLAYAYGKAGRMDKAQRVLKEMTELATNRYVPPQEFAIIYIGLGDNDNAFAWLEKAYEERFAGLIYFTVEPIFSNLKSDHRYLELVRRLNLPHNES